MGNSQSMDGVQITLLAQPSPWRLQNLTDVLENKTNTDPIKNNSPDHPSNEAIQRVSKLAAD